MHHMHVIRSTAVAALVTLAALSAPATARAQVGHLPEKSPYEDVKIGQTLTVMGGWLAVQYPAIFLALLAIFLVTAVLLIRWAIRGARRLFSSAPSPSH